MADKEEGTRTTGNSPPIEVEQGPLVSVTFQKNPARKQKYLEAQPKELGVILAGCLAIAATTLHIPTLRACLTMQILAIAASVFGFILTMGQFENGVLHGCWFDEYSNKTTTKQSICEKMDNVFHNLHAGGTLVQTALVAISITLAVYCCKVINCCSPGSRMPVITVQAPSNPSAPE
ncbi:uncharacterized protein LOC115529862 isoform X2 [Gadus morhua]|uniref:uncharacterized protein LOC115529862 isoform X2 n=1 Tax=Gadus morhua TaxID=8049 RepID=UPI0011B80773|nr:uncharacterized protein LOC115529862 isoform X2 [Gadus morhua]